LRIGFGAFLAGLILVVGTACGTGGPARGGNTSSGRELFTSGAGNGPSCASCHTLADANAKGTVGPNLDDAFAAAKANGFKKSTIQNIVLDQIRYPTKGSGMPANVVKGQDAQDVAAYVASAVGKKPSAPPAGQATGKGLYASLGCQSCHSLDGTRSTGPTFKGLFGSKVKLTSGQTVTADEAYLLESILDPDKQIVQGFQPGVMSGVIKKGQVSAADAKKLADFIKQQK
jgi:mono/diheme cytochrome c family protein